VRERTVQGFHCTADADIAFRNSSAKTSVVVEVKSGEDDRWPPVHQPVANFFHHNLVLHIRIQPRREQVQERLDAVRESSRKAMQLLEGTKRVCFIRV
jgi:hypothetical protein